MKLMKVLNRRFNSVNYYKYIINVPEEVINKLKWEEGDILYTDIDNGDLFVSKDDGMLSEMQRRRSFFERSMAAFRGRKK